MQPGYDYGHAVLSVAPSMSSATATTTQPTQKAGSGTAANADVVLKAVGVRKHIKPQFLGFSEAGNALRDGNVDAFAVSSAVPVPVVTAMAATRKIRLIPLNSTELKAVMGKNPAYAPVTIKASAYGSGVVSDAQSFGVPSTIQALSLIHI